MDSIERSDLYLALISALVAAVLSAGTTVIFFGAESRRARRDRREEYFVESAGDLAERVWESLQALSSHAEQASMWPEVRRTALVLRAGLLGQTPRYRLAGVEMVAEYLTIWLGSFLGTWAQIGGQAGEDRKLLATVAQEEERAHRRGDGVDRDLERELPFTEEDLDAALRLAYRTMLDMLEEEVLVCLTALAAYVPDGRPLELQKPDKRWPDYSKLRAQVINDRLQAASALNATDP